MQPLLDSISLSIRTHNWHAALATALTLPDICGNIQFPDEEEQKEKGKLISNRYTLWFDHYASAPYKRRERLDPDSTAAQLKLGLLRAYPHGLNFISEYEYELCTISGKECYGLRCKFLHHGSSEISKIVSSESLNNFRFTYPSRGRSYRHNNYSDYRGYKQIQLMVDQFTENMKNSAQQWWDQLEDDKEEIENSILKIFS